MKKQISQYTLVWAIYYYNRIMIQEIIVAIILLLVAVWLMRRIYNMLHSEGSHPCNTCTTPCKLKDEIHKNKGKRNKKCMMSEEKMPKN